MKRHTKHKNREEEVTVLRTPTNDHSEKDVGHERLVETPVVNSIDILNRSKKERTRITKLTLF